MAIFFTQMKNLLFLILLFSSNLFAQNRFSKLYNSEERAADLSSEVQVLSDGYLFCSTSAGGKLPDTLNLAKQFLYIVKTDFRGDTIWTKTYYRKAFGFGARISVKMSDSTYLLVGRIIDYIAKLDSNIQRDIFLIKINLQGDTLFTKKISLGPGDELPRKVIKTIDKGYAIFGQSCNQAISDCDYFLVKLDSNLNLEFSKRYSFNSTSFEQTAGVIQMIDSSYYLFGNTQLAVDEENAYLIKIDRNGNEIWHKRYGMDSFRRIGVSIHKFKAGILLNIVKATDLSESGDALLINLDTSGNIIWQKIYGSNRNDNLRNLFILKDSIILAVGNSKILSNNSYTHAWFLKINSNGDTIWQKIYNYNNVNDLIDQNNFFYDIKPTQDGFIILGNAYRKGVSPIEQDVWLLKVDSMGCLYQNCITPTGVDNEEKKNQELIIYPNPASNKIAIQSNTIYNHYCIFNLYGQEILEGDLQNNEINISELSKGLFILKLASDKEYVQVKFIKE
jgi:hypothetical protein